MADRFVDRRRGQATLWVIALLVTVVVAGYQRRTGPTWPTPIDVDVGGSRASGSLPRTSGGEGGALIDVLAPDPSVAGELVWRHYPSDETWRSLPMVRLSDRLVGELPHQPPAGKVAYRLRLTRSGAVVEAPASAPVVLRFKGAVPALVLLAHILTIFLSMVIGARALIGAILDEQQPQRHIPWLLAFLVAGGLLLGPIVQKYAFGAYWTGWPVGEDLTDTKTLVAAVAWFLAWIVASRAGEARSSVRRWAILGAAAVMLVVYLIPHSVRGSQIDWSKQAPAAAAEPAPR